MKWLLFVIFLLMSLFAYTGQILEYFKLDIPKYVVNYSETPIGLYPESSTKKRTNIFLKAGDRLPLAYIGKSGNWKYVKKSGRVLAIRSNKAEIEYGVYKDIGVTKSVLEKIYNYTGIVCVAFIFLIIFKVFSKKRNTNKLIQEHNNELLVKDYKITELINQVKIEKENQNTFELRIKENTKIELTRLRHELVKTVRIESEARHQASVDDMQASYDRLFNKYERMKSEGKELGIDFGDKNYEYLLSGRRFELVVATSLVKDAIFKILEWTPDKGFAENIKVEANKNPDLIIEKNNGEVIAIECKYRTGYYYKSRRPEEDISWSKLYQAKRYQNFSIKRNIPVWIALGLGNKPTKPREHFLVPLDKIIDASWEANPDGKGVQKIVPYASIKSNSIEYGNYSRWLQNHTYVT